MMVSMSNAMHLSDRIHTILSKQQKKMNEMKLVGGDPSPCPEPGDIREIVLCYYSRFI